MPEKAMASHHNIKREPQNNMAIPLRIQEAPRPQVPPQQVAGSNMMPPPAPYRHGNASSGMPPASSIGRHVGPWGQMTPGRSPQGHPGVHYGPIPVQGTPQDRFRREVLGHGRGEVVGSGQRLTPAPTPTLLSLRSSGLPQPSAPQTPSRPRQPVETPMTAPQRLSHACQKRGFNPLFEVFPTPSGKYGCNVNIGGTLLRNQGLFDTSRQAKEDTAMKGLDFMRQKGWATGSPSPPRSSRGSTRSQVSGPPQPSQNGGVPAARPRPHLIRPQVPEIQLQASPTSSQAPPTHSQGPTTGSRASIAHLEASVARLEATVARLQTPAISTHSRPSDLHDAMNSTQARRGRTSQAPVKWEQNVEMTDVPVSSGSRVSGIGAAEVLEQIQRITGMDVLDPNRESAEVTRAYLEGLAVGSRLAARRRSRSPTWSPQTSRVSRHRERSPLDVRVRLTPPPLHGRWSSRPAIDRYRPENHYRPGEDERLHDNTRARILDRESGESVESGEASEHGSGKNSEHGSRNDGEKRSSSQP